jgi:hypothetical protein
VKVNQNLRGSCFCLHGWRVSRHEAGSKPSPADLAESWNCSPREATVSQHTRPASIHGTTALKLPASCWFLLKIPFNPEDKGDIFLKGISWLQWITWHYIPEDRLCVFYSGSRGRTRVRQVVQTSLAQVFWLQLGNVLNSSLARVLEISFPLFPPSSDWRILCA